MMMMMIITITIIIIITISIEHLPVAICATFTVKHFTYELLILN